MATPEIIRIAHLKLDCYNEKMEIKKDKKTLAEDTAFFLTQLEAMLKNHNSMLSDKVVEGDVTSSSIAFSNSLLIASIKRMFDDHQELKEVPLNTKQEKKNEEKKDEDFLN